jgi:hypothetical protein
VDRKAGAVADPEVAPPTGYIIDVCATCGRHAVFPFGCGHRRTDRQWTTALRVHPSKAERARLTREMERNRREPDE